MAVFVFNDETKKNSHGFYLLNSGGRFERFNDNPVMLFNHDLAQLIGKWEKLRCEGVQLLADDNFDEDDPDALKIKGKVDRGYMRGASPGIIIHAAEWRENPATKEMELYVTEWELFEISVVSVPSNAGALSLKVYDLNSYLIRDENVLCHIDNIVKLSIYNNKQQPKMEFKPTAEALVALGIKDTADSVAISAAIIALKANLDTKSDELKTFKESAQRELEKRIEELVSLAIRQGRITADKKDTFVKLGISDFETMKITLESIPEKQNLAARISGISGTSIIAAERKGWTLSMWMKNDMPGLNKLKQEEPDSYEEIKKRN